MLSLIDKVKNNFEKSLSVPETSFQTNFSINEIEKSAKSAVPYFVPLKESRNTTNVSFRRDRLVPPATLRRMSMYNPVVFTAINTIINEVVSCKWAIVQADKELQLTPEEKKNQKEKIKEIEKFLKIPNKNFETFRFLLEKIIRDILVLDAGVIEKTKSFGKLTELYSIAGETIEIVADGHGKIEQYMQIIDNKKILPIEFELDELIYLMMNPSSNSLYGTSPLEVLNITISSFLYCERYNSKFFENYAIPKGILDLGPGVQEDQLDRFREIIGMEHKQQPHKMLIVGGASSGVKFSPLIVNPRDMELREYQNWLLKLILMVFGLSPSEIGIEAGFAGAPATGALLQSQAFRNKAIYPMMDRIAQQLTIEIVAQEFGREDLEFKFIEQISEQELLQKRSRQQIEISMGLTSPEEIRKEEGREDLSQNENEEDYSDEELRNIFNRSGSSSNEFKDKYEELKQSINNILTTNNTDEQRHQQLLNYISQQYNSLRNELLNMRKSFDGNINKIDVIEKSMNDIKRLTMGR